MKFKKLFVHKTLLSFGALAFLASIHISAGRAVTDTSRWQNYLDPSLISEIVVKDNKLYLATNGGLLIYDLFDSSFQQFTSKDGLPSNFLTALVFDSSGELYIGTEDAGIARIQFEPDGIEVTSLTALFHGLSDDRITTIAAWGDTVFYGTQNGAGVIISGYPGTIFPGDSLPSNMVSDVLADGDRVWIATDSGVVTLDQLGFIQDFSEGLPSLVVNVIERADTALWVGMNNGVARFNPVDSTWTSLIEFTNRSVFSLHLDGSTLWAGTNVRLYYYDGVTWRYVSVFQIYADHFLSAGNSQIKSIARAPDGNLYMGLADPARRRGGDLVFYDGDSVQYIQPNTLSMNNVVRFSFDLDGSLWYATSSFGIGKLTPDGEWFNYNSTTPGGDSLTTFYSNLALLADSDGIKWIGGPNIAEPLPLNELDDHFDKDFGNDVWTRHYLGSGGGDKLGSVQFLRAREDPAGNRWFVADFLPDPEADGIYILNRNKNEWLEVTQASTGGDMWDGKITDVSFSPDGSVYVANEGSGVQRWYTGGYDWSNLSNLSNDFWLTVGEVNGVQFESGATIFILALEEDGTLWIGTSAGLYKYDGIFTQIRARRGFSPGLLGNKVLDLVFDREGNLWVATDMGLNRIAHDDDYDIDAYTTPAAWQSELNLYYDQNVVSPIANAFCEALALHPEEDVLYIGTKGGISTLDISPEILPATDLARIYLYPNPVEGRKGHTDLKVGNITGPVFVEIYTLEGELIHSQEVSGPEEPEAWDLTTEEGFLAASGVYLVRVVSNGHAIVKTISVIH